jgi:hypothetical protein
LTYFRLEKIHVLFWLKFNEYSYLMLLPLGISIITLISSGGWVPEFTEFIKVKLLLLIDKKKKDAKKYFVKVDNRKRDTHTLLGGYDRSSVIIR